MNPGGCEVSPGNNPELHTILSPLHAAVQQISDFVPVGGLTHGRAPDRRFICVQDVVASQNSTRPRLAATPLSL